MNPNKGRTNKKKAVLVIPDGIRKATSLALNKAKLSENTKWPIKVKVDNPNCPAYPCQCAEGTYCCLCEDYICASVCQDGCDSFSVTPCLDSSGSYCPCTQDSQCPGNCAGLNCPCNA